MTQEPRLEVEVQGGAGEPVALPVGNDADADYVWTLELPSEVEAAGTAEVGGRPGTRLVVRAAQPGSYVLTATLADPRTDAAMTVLPIRLTVA